MVAASNSTGLGVDEIISFTANESGKYYLIAKAIIGEGNAVISYPKMEHDLIVNLEVPTSPEIDNVYTINATVINNGISNETNVSLFLYLNGVLVKSASSLALPTDAIKTINFTWIPTTYGIYNFSGYAPPVQDEFHFNNNIRTQLVSIRKIKLFNNMFIDYNFSIFDELKNSTFLYSFATTGIFHVNWEVEEGVFTNNSYWDVDTQTRIMTNSGGDGWEFGDGYQTPVWIFTDVSLGDLILIAVDAEGDHLFNVSDELSQNFSGFGPLDIWVLEDLTFPGGIAWYEKKTGILLNGTFFYAFGGIYNYTFKILDTNIEFLNSITIITPDILSSWGVNTSQTINWVSTGSISNVKLELYKDGVFELEIVASTSNDGEYYWTIPSGLEDSINYQIKIIDVSNSSIYDYSDYFEIKHLTSQQSAISGYNLYFLLGLFGIISTIVVKMHHKKNLN